MLKYLHKTKTAVALAAVLGASALTMPNAQAVNLTSDGLGDVLFFPYYTTRAGWNSYFHLTNTSDRTAILKVRFREAYNSRDVRDFNLILSPHDVWTAAVVPNATNTGARVITDDKSCTAPLLPDVGNGFTGIDFTNTAYTGTFADGGPSSLERTAEGYFEVWVMGVSTVPESAIADTNVVEYNSQHVSGVPRDCGVVAQQFVTPPTAGTGVWTTFPSPADGTFETRNRIAGNSTLINVANGQAVGAEPTALGSCEVDNIYEPRDASPTAANCAFTSTVVVDTYSGDPGTQQTEVVNSDFASGVNAVSAAMMRSALINEWTTAAATNATTDWVITFPTKHHYTDTVAIAPFQSAFAPSAVGLEDGTSCDDVTINAWNREELTQGGDVGFSPPEDTGTRFCYEVNVLTFNNSDVLSSAVSNNISPVVGDRGWARIGLGNLTITDTLSRVYTGKPVIGFGLTVRNNAVVEGNNRNFASAHDHKYERNIQ